jgi:quinol monooxygenase YgiN
MTNAMIRYKVKPDRAEENRQLIRAVYEELKRTQPTGIRYATFQLDDGVSFIHLHSSDSTDGSPLTELPAFKKFQQGIPDRCEERPTVAELHQIGSFRLFD